MLILIWPRFSEYDIRSISYMVTEAPSTTRVKRLRERRSRGVVLVAPVEVGEGGIDILIRNELLKQHQTRDRKAVGAACLAALEQWAVVRGPWGGEQAWRPSAYGAKNLSKLEPRVTHLGSGLTGSGA